MIRDLTRRVRQAAETVAGHDYFIPLAAIFLGVNSTLSEIGGSTGVERDVHAAVDLVTLVAIIVAFAYDRFESHRWQQALAENKVRTSPSSTTNGAHFGPELVRPRHHTVNVMRWDPDDDMQAQAVMEWVKDHGGQPYVDDWTDGSRLLVEDSHDLCARPGDRVILGVTGRFFQVPEADYHENYEAVA